MNHARNVAFLDAGLLRLPRATGQETSILRTQIGAAHRVFFRIRKDLFNCLGGIFFFTSRWFGNDFDHVIDTRISILSNPKSSLTNE